MKTSAIFNILLISFLFVMLSCSEEPLEPLSPGDLKFEPIIEIISPLDRSIFAAGDTIEFIGKTKDIEDENFELSVQWKSNFDGVIHSANADSSGISSFKIDNLSYNEHIITLIVKDSDGNTAKDSIKVYNNVPPGVLLYNIEKDFNSVHLKWSKSIISDFNSYKIYRSEKSNQGMEGDLIASNDAVDDTTYEDTEISLVPKYYYQVFVINSSGLSAGSNEMSIDCPAGIIIETNPSDAVIHPYQTWLYVLDNNNNTLSFLDYSKMEIKNSLSFSNKPSFMDIGDNGYGTELYIPFNNNEIRIYKAEDLNYVSSILTGISYIFSTITDESGHIFASMSPSPWWDDPLRSYSRATGNFIDGNGDFDDCRLRILPSRKEIIEITASVNPIDMDYYLLDNDGNFVSHHDDIYHGDHPLDPYIFRVSPSGEYVITSSMGAMYKADSTMNFIGLLTYEDAYFSDFAFDEMGTKIYAGCSNKKSVWVFGYPSSVKVEEISTKGYIEFLFRKGSQLIAIIEPESGSDFCAIQVIDLN